MHVSCGSCYDFLIIDLLLPNIGVAFSSFHAVFPEDLTRIIFLQSLASSVSDYFLYSHDLNMWYGVTLQREIRCYSLLGVNKGLIETFVETRKKPRLYSTSRDTLRSLKQPRGGVTHSPLSSANKPPLVKQLFMKLMKMFCITKNR